MAILMDDPTTYLKRDTDKVCIFLASSVTTAMVRARYYGVAIQVNMAGGVGIRVVSTLAQAFAAKVAYPPSTPWCIVDDNMSWEPKAYDVLRSYFGRPTTMDKALGVITDGIAWRPDKYPVYGM
jgi:hypothetical protein